VYYYYTTAAAAAATTNLSVMDMFSGKGTEPPPSVYIAQPGQPQVNPQQVGLQMGVAQQPGKNNGFICFLHIY